MSLMEVTAEMESTSLWQATKPLKSLIIKQLSAFTKGKWDECIVTLVSGEQKDQNLPQAQSVLNKK